jgi:protein O-GlcNAc transferase
MHLMASFFGLHDRTRFEISAYSISADDGSEYRRRARDSVDRFVDIRGEAAAASAARIHADGIDILVDLKGFTHESRPTIFALQPAPLRVAWLGYPASTDKRLNDYAIVDHVTVPAGCEALWSEKVVRMPHSYQVNDHLQPVAPTAPARGELGLPDAGFVYACFNQVYKIEPDVFNLWMRILTRVPGSVLWLYTENSMARSNLVREAQSRGVSPSRIVFGGTTDKPSHLARLARADLFLDTGTINAHTSASDALWAGLPVLTRPGDTFASRVGASLVTAAGLPQLACESFAQYEESAVRLANTPAELAEIRSVLQARERLPLFDTPRFTLNLERAFEMMWARHAAGQPPQSFDVPDTDSTLKNPNLPGLD